MSGILARFTEEQTVRILGNEEPMLYQPSQAVQEDEFDVVGSEVSPDSLRALVARMVSVMKYFNAVGLAAVQIGIPVRVIVIREGGEIMWLVNPVITRTLKRSVTSWETCLSCPGGESVERPAKCVIAYRDLFGGQHTMSVGGMRARILQHEIGHLDGKLIRPAIVLATEVHQ
jgi:peptide deformylase